MALTFTVEDGTGVTDANSYCSLAAADAYFDGRLHATRWTEATTAERQQALVMATRLIDQYIDWRGARVLTRETPAWPRTGMYDRAGVLIDATTLPDCLVESTAEFAMRLLDGDRVRDAEEAAVSVSAGSRSRSYLRRSAPVLPPSITHALAHLTVPSRLMRVG